MVHDFQKESCTASVLDVNTKPISEVEIRKQFATLRTGKATGVDCVMHTAVPELLKYAVVAILHLTKLFNDACQCNTISSDCRNRIIIPLPKKWNLVYCNNPW